MKALVYTTPKLEKLEMAEAVLLLRDAARRGNAKATDMLDAIERTQSDPQLVVSQRKPTSARGQTAHERWRDSLASGA